jgi:hypothetical protein
MLILILILILIFGGGFGYHRYGYSRYGNRGGTIESSSVELCLDEEKIDAPGIL